MEKTPTLTLIRRGSELAASSNQLEVLNRENGLPVFHEKILPHLSDWEVPQIPLEFGRNRNLAGQRRQALQYDLPALSCGRWTGSS